MCLRPYYRSCKRPGRTVTADRGAADSKRRFRSLGGLLLRLRLSVGCAAAAVLCIEPPERSRRRRLFSSSLPLQLELLVAEPAVVLLVGFVCCTRWRWAPQHAHTLRCLDSCCCCCCRCSVFALKRERDGHMFACSWKKQHITTASLTPSCPMRRQTRPSIRQT